MGLKTIDIDNVTDEMIDAALLQRDKLYILKSDALPSIRNQIKEMLQPALAAAPAPADSEAVAATLNAYEAALQDDINEGGDEAAEALQVARANLLAMLRPLVAPPRDNGGSNGEVVAQPLKDLLSKAASVCREYADELDKETDKESVGTEGLRSLANELQSYREPQGEVVAWQGRRKWREGNYGEWQPASVTDRLRLSETHEFRPLYAHPVVKEAEELERQCARLAQIIFETGAEQFEWLCERCNVIHTRQRENKLIQPCPKCHAAMVPTSINLRKIAEQRNAAIEECEKVIKSHLKWLIEHNLGEQARTAGTILDAIRVLKVEEGK